MKIYCPTCGNLIEEGVECSECGFSMEFLLAEMGSAPERSPGAPLDWDDPEGSHNTGGGPEKPHVIPPPKKKRTKKTRSAKFSLEGGMTYLIEEEKPTKTFRIMIWALRQGHNTLCITRSNPRMIRKKYETGDARIIWLSERQSPNEETILPNLETMANDIVDHADEYEEALIILDGLEFLVDANGFDPVIRFLRQMVDAISDSDDVLLVPIAPGALEDRQMVLLRREMERLD